MYKLNIMDAMTSEERKIYNEIAKNRGKKDYDPTEAKQRLRDEIKNNSKRVIEKKYLYYISDKGDIENLSRQIVLFENEIIRRCIKKDDKDTVPLVREIIILSCKSDLMSGILDQIIKDGIDIDGTHYIFYTSSTSQMKNAEITLLSQEFWDKNKSSLMCGLTEEKINKINTGKYFSALALNMSNSICPDPENEVSIDDVIIVQDFKTKVHGSVNYLDVDNLSIGEKEKDIEIEHMDGAGIFIPGTFPWSCQIRGGWLKGAIFPFDFHAFIREHEDKLSDINMKDAWGKAVSLDDFLNAKIILTDSQLKMRKYYDSLGDYRKKFKESGCKITINNIAHDVNIEDSSPEIHLAYQPLQTIPRSNMTDEAIARLAEKSIKYINDAKTDPNVALKLMGITDAAKVTNPLHAAILQYPYLLNDAYVKKVMQNALKAERTKAMGGKIILNGLWSYVCPDLYAFCQWLFLGESEPEGLLDSGHVYNKFYDNKDAIEEVCCIRYPHLSDCEHAIRKLKKSDECKKWFIGYDTVVSCHDLISKVLQCDWDGDHIAVIHDKAFLDVLDRDALPLYYDMSKAEPEEISVENKISCLHRSFENENIGNVSNAITKEFNSAGNPDLTFIRVLCAYNNFVIDYFKTQKKMDLGAYAERYEQMKDSSAKCPYFFRYAKGKKKDVCMEYNPDSNVDRISKYIQEHTKNGITKSIYTLQDNIFNPLIFGKKIDVDRKSTEYEQLQYLLAELKAKGKKRYVRLAKKMKSDDPDFHMKEDELFYYDCQQQISKIIENRVIAAQYLVDIEYFQEENTDSDDKEILWGCYGDILYDNLAVSNLLGQLGEAINDNSSIVWVKRKAYQSNDEKMNKIQNLIEETEERLKKEQEQQIVSITQEVYDLIDQSNTRKNSYNSLVLFIVYVLIKRAENRYGYHSVKIYKRSRKHITKQTICTWISENKRSIDSAIKQLVDDEYLVQVRLKKYDKFSLGAKFSDLAEANPSDSFEVKTYNPLIDYYKHNGLKKIKECKICHKLFIAEKDKKTCSNRCSRLLEKINKNGKVL